MRKLLTILLAVFVIASVAAPPVAAGAVEASGIQEEATCEYPVELTDATGEEITIDEAPDRVVALQPSDAQTVFEIGAEESLVGMPINEYTDHHDAGDRTDVSIEGEQNVDVETVVDLEPDVVLAANVTVEGDIEQLREAGITVYHFETAQTLEDVRENVRLTGELTGACEGAEERIEWMDERLSAIETALEDTDRPLAYWSLGGGWTAGEGTFQDEVLSTAGVENLGAQAGIVGWQEISDEVVIEEDPDWIVYGEDEPGQEPMLSEGTMETTAYEEGNLVAVDSNAINQPAPHVVYAIETIVEAIHPEAYEEAQAALEGDEADEEATDEADDATADEAADDEATDEDAADEEVADDADDAETEETDDADPADDADDAEEADADDAAETTDDATDEDVGEDADEAAEDEEDDSIPAVAIAVGAVAVIAVIAAAALGLRRR